MEIDLVGEGLKFMILGMVIVFVFLVVLVQIVQVQSKIINKFFKEKETTIETKSPAIQEDDAKHVAAIIAAVTEFRKNK